MLVLAVGAGSLLMLVPVRCLLYAPDCSYPFHGSTYSRAGYVVRLQAHPAGHSIRQQAHPASYVIRLQAHPASHVIRLQAHPAGHVTRLQVHPTSHVAHAPDGMRSDGPWPVLVALAIISNRGDIYLRPQGHTDLGDLLLNCGDIHLRPQGH